MRSCLLNLGLRGEGGVKGQIFNSFHTETLEHGELNFFYGMKKNAFFVILWPRKVAGFIENIGKSLYNRNYVFFQLKITQKAI